MDRRLAPRMEPDQGGLAHASIPTEGTWSNGVHSFDSFNALDVGVNRLKEGLRASAVACQQSNVEQLL
jgi:hypothetical protein